MIGSRPPKSWIDPKMTKQNRSAINHAQLQTQWLNVMSDLGFDKSLDCFQQLVLAYSEKHRHYHTLKHIGAMLGHLEKVDAEGLIQSDKTYHEIAIAIWFHDAIYKPFSATNERDSADWAIKFLEGKGYEQTGIKRIEQLIMATLHNGEITNDADTLMVDIDLTILGASDAVYDEFEQNVRKEYRWVPFFMYRKKRAELLAQFLSADRLYHNDYFYDRFEQQARKNLTRAISRLVKT